MEELVRRIHDRGHEVALHAHTPHAQPDDPPRYTKPLCEHSYEEQREILEYGADFIWKHSGERPVSFRGGDYVCNEDTFRALSAGGFKVDSSCYCMGRDGIDNQISYYHSLNQPCRIHHIWEFPVVNLFDSNASFRKFDINSIDINEARILLEQMKRREGFSVATLMLHSFSFVDETSKDRKPLYTLGKRQFFGSNPELMRRFEDLLDLLRADPEIEVVTYRELLGRRTLDFPMWGDGLFSLSSSGAVPYFPCWRRNVRITKYPNWREKLLSDEMARRDFLTPLFHQRQTEMSPEKALENARKILNGDGICLDESSAPEERTLTAEGDFPACSLAVVRTMTAAFEASGQTEFLRTGYAFLQRWNRETAILGSNAAEQAALEVETLLDYGRACTGAGFWKPEFLRELFQILEAVFTNRKVCGIIRKSK